MKEGSLMPIIFTILSILAISLSFCLGGKIGYSQGMEDGIIQAYENLVKEYPSYIDSEKYEYYINLSDNQTLCHPNGDYQTGWGVDC